MKMPQLNEETKQKKKEKIKLGEKNEKIKRRQKKKTFKKGNKQRFGMKERKDIRKGFSK